MTPYFVSNTFPYKQGRHPMAGMLHTLRTSGLTEKFHLDYQKYAQASSKPHACTMWEKRTFKQ
jgi:hypothetical protein